MTHILFEEVSNSFLREYPGEFFGSHDPWRIQCPLQLTDVVLEEGYCHISPRPIARCGAVNTNDGWTLGSQERNLEMFSQGSGVDSQGVWWRGGGEDNIAPVDLAPADPTADLAQALGLAMLGVDNFVCSLATKCHADLDCSAVGSRKALGLGLSKGILRSEWGYCALTSLININEQLSNQYNSIQGASIRAIAETFRIDNFYKAPDQKFDIRNAMLGLGTAFSILGGFAPAIAPVTGIGGAALSAVGGFLGNIISESLDLNVVQKTYASKVEDVYKQYVNTIDNMTTILLKGQDIEPGVNIRTMMRNGSWSDYSTLTPISAIEQSLKIEILSRSIDALWKKPPSNKMWVLYVDLNDDRSTTTKCIQDQTGPQELKYCADRGIYYAYNYIEDGHLQGHIDYPPGAAMLKKIDIQPNVSLNVNT